MTIKRFLRIAGVAALCPLLGIAFLLTPTPAQADWIPGDGHKMHWPQLPDEHGWNVKAFQGQFLADDFQCSQSGPITEVHFWGSWKGGVEGQISGFRVAIYSDVPDPDPLDPTTHSSPGNLLWGPVFIDAYIAQQITPVPQAMEGWNDPVTGDMLINDHSTYFQYNIFDIPNPFVQTQGEIYWLAITAEVVDDGTGAEWGWKSTQDHFNDDAVVYQPTGWQELYEPDTGPLTNAFQGSLDATGLADGIGDFAYNDQWYVYPSGWSNLWFYDHPFDSNRFKDITITINVATLQPGVTGNFTLAANWSTEAWSLTGNPPGPRRPPLPSDGDEALYIGRQVLFDDVVTTSDFTAFTFSYTIDTYNPEWVSIDVQGDNIRFFGTIEHWCRGTEPRSMDLSFVINGPDPTGACCWPDGSCTTETQVNCENGPTGVVGTYLGDGSVCLGDANGDGIDDACGPVVVTGACCLQDGTCIVTDQFNCLASGGTYLGDNSVCLGDADGDGVDDACETPAKKGACCWKDGSCTIATAAYCVQSGGTYQGDNTACLGDSDGNGVDDACETPEPDFKWEQSPDIEPTGFDVNATHTDNQPYILADDFECTVTGPITRIHVYGSWSQDVLPPGGPTDVNFVLSIHADVPDPDGSGPGYSHPGELLCLLTDLQFEVKPYATDLQEGWLNPPDDLNTFGDKVCWEYTFYLPPDICIQQGTPSNPVVYWLDVQAYPGQFSPPTPDRPLFGWKSSLQHWNDDGTWAFGQDQAGATLAWEELIYPPNHPMAGESVDLAFKIIGSQGVPTPTGACCWPDGSCTVESQADCENSPNGVFGTYQGDGSICLGDANANGIDDACEDILPTGACCYEDPLAGPQCVNTTQSDCISLGGAWYAGQDCNDATFECPSQEPQGACCWTDAAGNMNCINTTEGDCLNAYGGTWYLGQDCSWFDCPTPQPIGACCYGHPGSPLCVNTTEDLCKTVYNGTWFAGQNCATWSCPSIVQVPKGACCYDDPVAGPSCINTSKKNCLKVLGGTWYPGQNCATFDCPTSDQPPKGACCYGDPASPSCVVTTQSECLTAYGGTWYLGQDCATFDCPVPIQLGACCYETAVGPACVDGITQLTCEAQYGGNWYAGQTCATIDCPTSPPLGACCYSVPGANDACVETPQVICLQVYGGTWYSGQTCATIDCPNTAEPLGACCYGDPASPSCVNTTQTECITAYGGTWYLGQDCATFTCPVSQQLGACCYETDAGPACIDGVTQLTCQSQFGGNWYPGQDCTTIDCPTTVKLGACCYEIAGAGPGCAYTTQSDCLQTYGGTWYAGQDCSTVDCGYQSPTGACCYGDPASPSCVNTTHAECISAYGGTWYANTDCASFECPVPHELGACCIDGAAGPFCIDNVPQSVCDAQYGGIWHGGQTCADIADCVNADLLGACCYKNAVGGQSCANTTEANCTQAYGGDWHAGQNCASFDCPVSGCCIPPTVGDVDQSGVVDITDVSVLIDNQFLTLTPLVCEAEGDCDLSGAVDITDVSVLIDNQFLTLTPLPPCP